MIDKDMPCRQTCPDRTAECKRTCPKWAKWEEKKKAIYEARKRVDAGRPDSSRMKNNAKKNRLNALKGRKR